MIARIHINQHIIKSNLKTGRHEPVITVKTSRANEYANKVAIYGPSVVIYSPDKPLSCGAKVWIECQREHVVLDPLAVDPKLAELIKDSVNDCEVR